MILKEGLDEYLQNIIPERETVLAEMEDYAEKNNFPIVGPQVGQVLMQYAMLTEARRIFELGSGYGYSAIWFARSTPDEARIYCTDGDERNKKLADEFLKKAGVRNKIKFLVGDAITQLNSVEGDFDIIYNDVDKEGYPDVYDAAIPRLRKGGLLITDNTLWSGRIIEPEPSEATRGVMEYNRKAFNDPRVLSMILPIRDGVCVSLKLD